MGILTIDLAKAPLLAPSLTERSFLGQTVGIGREALGVLNQKRLPLTEQFVSLTRKPYLVLALGEAIGRMLLTDSAGFIIHDSDGNAIAVRW